MKKKRPVSSPSGSTPGKPSNKVLRSREACNSPLNSRTRKSLSFGNEVVSCIAFLAREMLLEI